MRFLWFGPLIIMVVTGIGIVLPASYGQVSVINDNLVISKNETKAWILGEIVNNSSIPINNVKVVSSFLNEKGEIIKKKKESPMIETVLPDHKTPFKIHYSLEDLSKEDYLVVQNYTLNVEFNPGTEKKQTLNIVESFVSKQTSGQMNVSGTIINHGKTTANNVKIVSVFYNKDGKVIGIEKGITKPHNIPPNKNGTFSVSFTHTPVVNSADNYYVTAESNEFAVIPEFSSTVIVVLVVAVSLIIVIMSKTSSLYNRPF